MDEFSEGEQSRKTLEVPADLLKALADDLDANRIFKTLMPDEQHRVITWVKNASSRLEMKRRAKQAIEKLKAGRLPEPI